MSVWLLLQLASSLTFINFQLILYHFTLRRCFVLAGILDQTEFYLEACPRQIEVPSVLQTRHRSITIHLNTITASKMIYLSSSCWMATFFISQTKLK